MTNTHNPSAWAQCTPKSFADLAFADDYTQQDLHDYVQYPLMCGNIILEGGFGSGKSTIAAVIAKERLGNTASVYELNGEAWTEDTLSTLRGTFNLARTCDEGIRPVDARSQAFSGGQFHGMSSSMRLIL
jgi:DNA replication protein DnaC